MELSTEEKRENLMNELSRSIKRWNDIYENGCNDPFWPDGANLNLVRNHIIYFIGELKRLDDKTEQISMFAMSGGENDIENDKRIPVVVPTNFMVRKRRCRFFDGCTGEPIYKDSTIQK